MENQNVNWSLLISIIALAVSVLCPVITAWVNNYYQMKFRDKDFFDKHRAEIIEGFLRTAGACTCSETKSNREECLIEYGKYYAEIHFYAPESLWKDLYELHIMLISGSPKGAHSQLAKISKVLLNYSPRAPRSQKKNRN